MSAIVMRRMATSNLTRLPCSNWSVKTMTLIGKMRSILVPCHLFRRQNMSLKGQRKTLSQWSIRHLLKCLMTSRSQMQGKRWILLTCQSCKVASNFNPKWKLTQYRILCTSQQVQSSHSYIFCSTRLAWMALMRKRLLDVSTRPVKTAITTRNNCLRRNEPRTKAKLSLKRSRTARRTRDSGERKRMKLKACSVIWSVRETWRGLGSISIWTCTMLLSRFVIIQS